MNALQLSKHWRLWSAACKTQGWKTNDDQKRYETYAAALQNNRSSGGNDALTSPSPKRYSVKDFTAQRDIDALFDHLTQLATNHTSLTAALRQANPDAGERKRLIWSIKQKSDDAYIRHIAVNKFGTGDFAELDLSQLTQLRNTLAARNHAKKKKKLEPYNRTNRHALPADAESDDALECGVSTPPSTAQEEPPAAHIPF